MENNTNNENDTPDMTPKGPLPAFDWDRQGAAALKTALLLLTAALFGFIGGNTAPFFTDMLRENAVSLTEKQAGDAASAKPGRQVVDSADDGSIVSLVERNAPGVVSIVITKDVPKVKSLSPFFFFDPFGGAPLGQQRGSGATEKQQVGSGSGFIVSSDGLIVTNRHVVADTVAEYTVITNDGQEHVATVLARDPNNDIAILRIEGKDLPVLDLGDSEQVKVGQTVIAIGNPLGEFANSVTRGIISGVKREVEAGSARSGQSEQLSGIFQTDAAINPGNSGGPLFNMSGEVIGVNVAMAQGAENIAFALPINQVKRIIEQVKTTGKISTPYIGVRYLILNAEIAKENSLPLEYGALVLRGEKMTDFAVIPGSPADKVGIVENDILLEIDGTKIDEKHQVTSLVAEKNVGDEVTIKLWHKGETKDVRVKLEERK
ncbi:MAG: trypsin-like peptidase domain-containing protein [Candidatus Moranbacteria bacterium]|nr:trypsin-like peptidase domain-containing protein [Candidatus Moranbacteria bacterium]MBP7696130.1 trypsin-like peptidase domain-containing protein [Candidatus Moranbacteria bacterium]